MNIDTCQTIEPLLVDYLDGDFGESDSQRVARHVDQCRDCQAKPHSLQRSLAIAKHQWEEAASTAPAVTIRAAERPRPKRMTVAVGAACVAVVMLGVAIAALQQGRGLVHRDGFHAGFREGEAPAEPSSAHETEVARNPSPMPASKSLGRADIDAMIQREVQSARLAAPARLLASQPELEEFSDRAASYLSSAYGDYQSPAELEPTLRNNGS